MQSAFQLRKRIRILDSSNCYPSYVSFSDKIVNAASLMDRESAPKCDQNGQTGVNSDHLTATISSIFMIMRTHSVARDTALVLTRSGCTTFSSKMLVICPFLTLIPVFTCTLQCPRLVPATNKMQPTLCWTDSWAPTVPRHLHGGFVVLSRY